MANTTTELTDGQVARMMTSLMAYDTVWRTTDHLISVTAGRVPRDQMLRVLFALHEEGKINYKRDKGWRFTR